MTISSPKHVLTATMAGLLLLSLLACASPSPTAVRILQPGTEERSTATPGPGDTPSDTPAPIELEPQATKPPPARKLLPLPIATPQPGRVTGEVPADLLEAILSDAEARTGLAQEELTIVRAESVTWRDGSLGCPQPGMAYTQALVPGYRIVLGVGHETLDYHASDTGAVILCPQGMAEEGVPQVDRK